MNDGMELVEHQPAAMAPVAAPQHQLATTPMELLSMVTARGASIEEIRQFMDLMERQQASEARAAFVRAMAAFKKNPPEILKDKRVEHSGIAYDHATLGNVCEQIIAALAEHGISHDWTIEQPTNGMIRVTCTLTHDLGHSKSTAMEAPADNSGKKNPIQSIASSVSYLERYTLLAACGIAVKDGSDNDGRGAGTEAAKPIQKAAIGGKAFEKALAAVEAKEYTAAEIRKYYALTPDQDTALTDIDKEVGKK